ncbi:unnamed protein product [Parajaminaea phylloscopi]
MPVPSSSVPPSSASSASSSSSSSPTSPGSTASDGPANLGSMSSLDPSCTPLKHRYDTCFNAWFHDYLGVAPSGPIARTDGGASAKKRGFWSRGNDSNAAASAATDGSDDESLRRLRADKRNELESKCGQLFAEYQSCVKKALQDRDLLPLISTAREYNPFPFPEPTSSSTPQSSSSSSTPNAPPFPFPAATQQERKEAERKEGW